MYLPKDRVTNEHQGYGFIEFRTEADANYAIRTLNMVKLFEKPLRVGKAVQDKGMTDVGANLFIGNLDSEVDETLLYNTFSAFGVIINNPKIMRDPETGVSKGFGFVSFDDFEASDAAIEAMDGQYLGGRAISVAYAYKKDTHGERHGTPAERLLAAQRKAQKDEGVIRPHTMFATGPQQQPQPGLDIGTSTLGLPGYQAGVPMPSQMMDTSAWAWAGHQAPYTGIPSQAVAPPEYAVPIPPPPPPGPISAGGTIEPREIPPPPPPAVTVPGGAGEIPPPPPPTGGSGEPPPPPPPSQGY